MIYRNNGIPTNEVTVGILRNGTAQTLDLATNTTSVVLKYIGDLGDGSEDTDGDSLTAWEEIRVYGTELKTGGSVKRRVSPPHFTFYVLHSAFSTTQYRSRLSA